MTLRAALAAVSMAFAVFMAAPASAKINCNDRICWNDQASKVVKIKVTMHRERKHRHAAPLPLKGRVVAREGWHSPVPSAATVTAQILPHPAGCPRVAFCGCGAAVQVFGSAVRSLWLAANWFQFPRAEPGPGMVAVRRHHVMVIEAMLEDGRALVYDANSGNHQTRRHARSLAGYSVRDPHGSRVARAE